ncbi:hypothetical protein ACSSVY_002270 [Roseovarius sp. MBR-51]
MPEILAHPEVKPLLLDEQFSVDGTLINAWASMKAMTQMDEMIEQIWVGAAIEAPGAHKPSMKIWN